MNDEGRFVLLDASGRITKRPCSQRSKNLQKFETSPSRLKVIHKSFCGFLALLLSFGVFTFYSPPAKAIKDFTVQVTPRRAGSVARYALTMSLEKKLEIHQWLHVNFPKGTTLTPPLPEEEHQRKLRLKEITESIGFGNPCSACTGLPIIVAEFDGTLTMKFHLTGEVDPTKEGYQSITITIFESAGFTNPLNAGSYIFKFKNQQEPKLVDSSPVTIEESEISKPVVTVQNPIFNQMSGYDIEFKTGSAGQLGFRTNKITVMFPLGTMISTPPEEILYQLVTINGYPILKPPIIQDMFMTFVLPFKIPDASVVKIHIDPKWGIKNPRSPGLYKLLVNTSTDLGDVSSEPYEIKKGNEPVVLDIDPPKCSKLAEFSMSLVAENSYQADKDVVHIQFPEPCSLPAIINPHTITIQGKVVQHLEIKKNNVVLTLPEFIEKGKGVEIVFTRSAGILTPFTPLSVDFFVTFNQEENHLKSNSVMIETQQLTLNQIKLTPPNASEKATYQLNLIFGDNLVPKKGEEIQVQFSFLEKPITIILDNDIPEDPKEYKLFLHDIQNPPSGYYTVSVSTTREKQKVQTPLWIIPARPVTKINLTGGKIGKNNWYIDLPLIGFESNDPDRLISIYWDDPKKGIVIYSGQSMPPDPGQYITKLYYFSTNAYGQEIPKSFEIKVDCVNPYINSITPENEKIETNQKSIKIEGKVSPIKTIIYGKDKIEPDRELIIQGKPVIVKDDGSFSSEIVLQEGMNEIIVHLEDDAGRFVEKNYSVLRDSIPPKLDVIYPLQNATVLDKKMILRGKTEPSALLVINNEFVYVEEDGSFTKEINLSRVGIEQVEIIATDNLGNSTTRIIQFFYGYTILLKIGRVIARINTIEKQMPLAPFIQQDRTLVPFRFIGEELKAKVGYQVDNKKTVKYVTYELGNTKIKLTIGSIKALVNGKEVNLEVPAQIIKGSTIVPLRFVTEGLGCSVQWEPITQNITILYPKWNI
jgi:hypothetical protein